jgi:hypothetical protein
VPFIDGVEREVREDADGRQWVTGYGGERVYGVWLMPADERAIVSSSCSRAEGDGSSGMNEVRHHLRNLAASGSKASPKTHRRFGPERAANISLPALVDVSSAPNTATQTQLGLVDRRASSGWNGEEMSAASFGSTLPLIDSARSLNSLRLSSATRSARTAHDEKLEKKVAFAKPPVRILT